MKLKPNSLGVFSINLVKAKKIVIPKIDSKPASFETFCEKILKIPAEFSPVKFLNNMCTIKQIKINKYSVRIALLTYRKIKTIPEKFNYLKNMIERVFFWKEIDQTPHHWTRDFIKNTFIKHHYFINKEGVVAFYI